MKKVMKKMGAKKVVAKKVMPMKANAFFGKGKKGVAGAKY